MTNVFSILSRRLKSVQNWNSLPVLIVCSSWMLSVSSRLIKSGDVYGMDFGLFHPDGTNYLRLSQDFAEMHFQNSTIYAWSRPLYPLLSTPFYILMDTEGMLIIPAISFLLFGLTLLRFADDRKLKLTVSFFFVILTSSSTLLRWVVADLTDSLHLFLFTLCCLGIYKRWRFQYLFLIVLLGSLARPMGILWAALFFSCAIRDVNNARKNYFVLSITSLSLFLLNTLLMAIYGGFGPNSKSLSEQILSIPLNFISLIVVEFGQLAVLDRVLFYFVLLSMALAAARMSDPWSLIHFNVILASFLLSAWIGVWGVNFRYQLPVLATAVIVMIRFPQLKRILSLK